MRIEFDSAVLASPVTVFDDAESASPNRLGELIQPAFSIYDVSGRLIWRWGEVTRRDMLWYLLGLVAAVYLIHKLLQKAGL